MRVYKLTDEDMRTYGGLQWERGVWHEASGSGYLCSSGWLHAYEDPLLAVLHDPIHGRYGDGGRLWEAEADGAIERDGQMKLGAQRLRIVREIRARRPYPTPEQRAVYAIYCAQAVAHLWSSEQWLEWADSWLSGTAAARAEEERVAAWAAAWAAEAGAAWLARAAARAAGWAATAAAPPYDEARAARAVAEADVARSAETAGAARHGLVQAARRAMEWGGRA